MRTLLLPTLVCALLAGPVGAAEARRHTPTPVTLAGTTVVTGSQTATIAVRLPQDVPIDTFTDIDLVTQGRITGVVLHQDGGPTKQTAGLLSHGMCAGSGCQPAVDRLGQVGLFDPIGSGLGAGTLPAGDYHLQLLADGGPVTATLHLRGLTGSVTLTPHYPTRASLREPAPTVAIPASDPVVFAAGSSHVVPATGGLEALVVWKEQPLAIELSVTGRCIYSGLTPPKGPLAYQYPCPGADDNGTPGASNGTAVGPATTPYGPGRFISYMMAGNFLAPGAYSIGGHSDTTGPVTSATLQQLWLDYDA